MRRTRYIVGVLAIVMAALCTSCLYSRLYSFKKQLGLFEEYVRLANSGRTLEFLKPVVEPDDLKALTDLDPTHVELQAKGEQIHTYNYRSLSPVEANETACQLRFTLHFDVDGLIAFQYPMVAAQVLGTNFVVGAAKAIGQSKLNRKNYALDWASESNDPKSMPIPSYDEIRQVFGVPLGYSNTPSYKFVNYAFLLEGNGGIMQTNGTMDAAFQFDPSNSLLRHAVIHIGRLQLVIDLPRLP